MLARLAVPRRLFEQNSFNDAFLFVLAAEMCAVQSSKRLTSQQPRCVQFALHREHTRANTIVLCWFDNFRTSHVVQPTPGENTLPNAEGGS